MISTHAIRARGLCKTFGDRKRARPALDHLDLEVEPGTVFGLIGPNGAGKSTLIKILVGLVRPDDGEATVCGAPAGSTEARRHLGYLPEVATYHEFMTARELLDVHARLAGVGTGERKARCESALDSVGLLERANSRIREYSKGMKQRFGIAQALVGQPPLLILDELTSGLDPSAQRELREITLQLSSRAITVFFSSHFMSEVEAVCDRVAIIHQGRIQASGTLASLLTDSDAMELRFRLEPAARDILACKHSLKVQPIGPDCLASLPRPHSDHVLADILSLGGSVGSLSPMRRSLEEVFHDVVGGNA